MQVNSLLWVTNQSDKLLAFYGGPKGRAVCQYLSDNSYAPIDNIYAMVDNNYAMIDNNYVTMMM